MNVTNDTLKTRRFVVAAIDGMGRIIDILEQQEVEVRNHLHLRRMIEEIETAQNESTTALKANRYAAIKCIIVKSFRNMTINSVAAGLNAIYRKEEQRRREDTQKFLAQKKAKDAAKRAEKERAAANAKAIVLYKPQCQTLARI